MIAAGKTSPIFSFGTNIRYFIQSKGFLRQNFLPKAAKFWFHLQ
jgi:hypothetical protein